MSFRRFLEDIMTYWRSVVLVLAPIVFLPIPLCYTTSEAKAAYGVCVMAVYWVTECLPLPVTALLPTVIFPIMGVLSASQVAANYIKDSNLLLFGGLAMAVSIESSGLHRRIALGMLSHVSSQPKWILFGFMLPTFCLSMWISNTAAAAMMLPVAEAVLQQLRQIAAQNETANSYLKVNTEDDTHTEKMKICEAEERAPLKGSDTQWTDKSEEAIIEIADAEHQHPGMTHKKVAMFSKALCLAVAYAANAGGSASLTGSPPNIVFKGQVDELYAAHDMPSPVTFASWMVMGVPCALLTFLIAWFWLQLYYLGWRETFCAFRSKQSKEDKVNAIFKEEYRKLGPIRFAESVNVVCFALLVCLWIFREAEGFTGWGQLPIFNDGYISDTTAVLFIVIVLFAIPASRPRLLCCRKDDESAENTPSLLTWEILHQKLHWGLVILVGGGFALADACQKSGLSSLVGQQLTLLGALPGWLLVSVVVFLMAAVTEVTSNTAITTLFLPIIAGMSESLGLHPLYLMMPATMAASYAFMLPVATPPNAIVFAHGHLRVIDMVKAGIVMNLLCVLVTTVATHTWVMAYFDLLQPPWSTNTTSPLPHMLALNDSIH